MVSTVLVVDDDPIFVDVLNFALSFGGFATRSAYNGTEALEILSWEPIDVVILDVMLPDMDGLEICRRIRGNPRTAELPVLMLSARGEVTDKLNGFESGADDYVPKPANPKEIIARIRALLGRVKRARGIAAPLLAFAGAKGGVGNTTVALNVALSLVAGHERVVFVDLGGVGLSAAWMLDLRVTQSLTVLTAAEDVRLSLRALQSGTLIHSSGLHYLPVHGPGVTEERCRTKALVEALGLLQPNYDVVIVDVSASALAYSGEVLASCTTIIPVAAHNGLSFWHLRGLLEWLRHGKLEHKVPGFVLVEQSVGLDKVAPADVVEQVKLGILAVIPPAPGTQSDGGVKQKPLCLTDPQSPAAVAMTELGRRVMAAPIAVPFALKPQGQGES
jgi:CheY-like chemotaxis protein/cellulose biosynthesis protein BcsQ